MKKMIQIIINCKMIIAMNNDMFSNIYKVLSLSLNIIKPTIYFTIKNIYFRQHIFY